MVDDPLVLQWAEVDGEEEYQVSGVHNGMMYRNQLQYLMDWTEYDSATWKPIHFVDGRQAVHQPY
jgi:hypothetical protein